MPLSLPAHLAPQAVRRALVDAQHTVAFTLLSIAIVGTLVFQGSRPSDSLWPAALALVPSLGLLLLRHAMTPKLWSLAYLLVSGIALHFHALVLLTQPLPINESDGFSFLAAKAAIVMVGGAALGIGAGIFWAMAGYAVAELSVGLAQVSAGQPTHFDLPLFLFAFSTVTVIPLIAFNSERQRRAQPLLHQAAEVDRVADLRYRIEVRAATLMHDTVLNQLAAIAESTGRTLDPNLRSQIELNVTTMASEEWLAEATDEVNAKVRGDWQASGLFAAIHESRLLGLEVDTTGDFVAVGRLARDASLALGLAVKQCLVNVVKHSGTLHAEVAVYGTEDSVSVMIVDNGRGFSEASTSADRLGLRSSVRKRMELVGGQVNVWSTPGRGTSVMITIPLAGSEPVPKSGGTAGSP